MYLASFSRVHETLELQVAFAMVGNRVEKTFRKAGLKRWGPEAQFVASDISCVGTLVTEI